MRPVAVILDSEMLERFIAELWVFLEDRGIEAPQISVRDFFGTCCAVVVTFSETDVSYVIRHFLMSLDRDCRWRRDHRFIIGPIDRRCEVEYVVAPDARGRHQPTTPPQIGFVKIACGKSQVRSPAAAVRAMPFPPGRKPDFIDIDADWRQVRPFRRLHSSAWLAHDLREYESRQPAHRNNVRPCRMPGFFSRRSVAQAAILPRSVDLSVSGLSFGSRSCDAPPEGAQYILCGYGMVIVPEGTISWRWASLP